MGNSSLNNKFNFFYYYYFLVAKHKNVVCILIKNEYNNNY